MFGVFFEGSGISKDLITTLSGRGFEGAGVGAGSMLAGAGVGTGSETGAGAGARIVGAEGAGVIGYGLAYDAVFA